MGDEIRYLCNWINLGESASVAGSDIYVEVNEDEHQERGWGLMMDRGLFYPASLD